MDGITLGRRLKIAMLKISYEVKLQWVIKTAMCLLYGRMFFTQCTVYSIVWGRGGGSLPLFPSIKKRKKHTKRKPTEINQKTTNETQNATLVRKKSIRVGQ